MDLQKAKTLIPEYLDGSLQPYHLQEFKQMLVKSPQLQKEVEVYQKTWDLVRQTKEIEPSAGYVSHFWTRLAQEETKPKTVFARIQVWGQSFHFKPIFVGACVTFLLGAVAIKTSIEYQATQHKLAQLSAEEVEMIEEIDIAENLEIIEDLEFYENMDVIEKVAAPDQSFRFYHATGKQSA